MQSSSFLKIWPTEILYYPNTEYKNIAISSAKNWAKNESKILKRADNSLKGPTEQIKYTKPVYFRPPENQTTPESARKVQPCSTNTDLIQDHDPRQLFT